MAGWFTQDEKTRKSCRMCETFVDPGAFQQGLTVHVGSANKCEDCEVTKAFPIPENEIVRIIYTSLPANFDGMTGIRRISADDIYVTMKMLEIPKELWCDLYNRVVYYHNKTSEIISTRMEAERPKK